MAGFIRSFVQFNLTFRTMHFLETFKVTTMLEHTTDKVVCIIPYVALLIQISSHLYHAFALRLHVDIELVQEYC